MSTVCMHPHTRTPAEQAALGIACAAQQTANPPMTARLPPPSPPAAPPAPGPATAAALAGRLGERDTNEDGRLLSAPLPASAAANDLSGRGLSAPAAAVGAAATTAAGLLPISAGFARACMLLLGPIGGLASGLLAAAGTPAAAGSSCSCSLAAQSRTGFRASSAAVSGRLRASCGDAAPAGAAAAAARQQSQLLAYLLGTCVHVRACATCGPAPASAHSTARTRVSHVCSPA